MTLQLVLVSTPGFSQSNPEPAKIICPDPAKPSQCFVPGLKPGDVALMHGDLLSPDLAIDLFQAKDSLDARVEAAVTATVASLKEDMKFKDREHELDLRVKDAEIDALRRSQPSWYEKPAIVATVTAVVTGIIVTIFYVGTGGGQRLRDAAAGE